MLPAGCAPSLTPCKASGLVGTSNAATRRNSPWYVQAVPLLAMLDDLVPRMEAGHAGPLRRVVFVWLSHTGDEFSIMDPSLLELARQALLHIYGLSWLVAVCEIGRASQLLPGC